MPRKKQQLEDHSDDEQQEEKKVKQSTTKSSNKSKKKGKRGGDESDDEPSLTTSAEQISNKKDSKKKSNKKNEELEENQEEQEEKEKSTNQKNLKKGKEKKGQSKKLQSDEEEEEEESIPAPSKKKSQKKKGKKGKKNDEESEDDEQVLDSLSKLSVNESNKNQKKKGKKEAESDEELEEEAIPLPSNNKKKNQKKDKFKQKPVEMEEEEEEEEEEEIPIPVSNKKKTQKKKDTKSKHLLEEEEGDEEEEAIPIPVKTKNNQKKNKSNQKSPEIEEIENVEEGEEGEEEESIPLPANNKKKQKRKETKSKQLIEEETSEGEDIIPLPAKQKKQKKGKKKTPQILEHETEEIAEEEEEPKEEPKEEEGLEEESIEKVSVVEDSQERIDEMVAPIETTETEKASEHKKSQKKKGKKGKKEEEEKPIEEGEEDHIFEDRKGSESMSKDIKIEKFDLSYPGKVLFKDATLALAHGRRYGLVAPNGTGKSTLLKNIATREDAFIGIPSHFDIHYVEQEVVADDTPALQAVIAADTERTRLLALEKKLNESTEDGAGERLQEVHARLDQIEAYSAEARASSILTGLQFDEQMKHQPTKDFSGGWRMRISLARALFKRPTLLLLDEPTNHLDLLAVIWLETYLLKWKNTLLIVSHDQDFLNTVSTDVIHIYQQKLHYYKGNYNNFKHQFDQNVSLQRKAYEQQQKAIKAAQQQKAKKEDKTKSKDKALTQVKRNKQLTQKGKNNRTKEEDNGKEAKLLDAVPKDYNVIFEFPDPEPLSIPIIQVNDASFGYDPSKILFRNLEFGIDMESRIALVGPNGAGKSTLLKLLNGELDPTTGVVSRNRKLIVGKFSQHFVDVLDMSVNPIEYLSKKYPELTEEGDWEQNLRRMIGRFGITGKTQLQKISLLSGGQKSRVVFADICMTNPHLLFLDEPTNHLDIESVDALAEALNDFKGGLILVSHDARLIRELDCSIWVVANNEVNEFEGGFDEYRDELRAEFEERLEQEETDRREKEDARRKQREETMKNKK